MSAVEGAIAAGGLSVDDCRADGLFGEVIGRLEIGMIEEEEQCVAVGQQMQSKANALVVKIGVVEEPVHRRFDLALTGAEPVGSDGSFVTAIAQGESLFEDCLDLLEKAHTLRRGRRFKQFLAAPQQMREAELPLSLGEPSGRAPIHRSR